MLMISDKLMISASEKVSHLFEYKSPADCWALVQIWSLNSISICIDWKWIKIDKEYASSKYKV